MDEDGCGIAAGDDGQEACVDDTLSREYDDDDCWGGEHDESCEEGDARVGTVQDEGLDGRDD